MRMLSVHSQSAIQDLVAAALGLSYLAKDFSCKVTIYEERDLEHLVHLLGSSNADVQKTPFKTISLNTSGS